MLYLPTNIYIKTEFNNLLFMKSIAETLDTD